MESKLSLTIWGVKGGAPKISQAGLCEMYIDPSWLNDHNSISADAFSGRGDTYKRRESCLINVTQKGKTIFSGSFDQLCNIINSNANVPNVPIVPPLKP